jgi:hypothetical protein
MITNAELIKNHDVSVRPRALMEAVMCRKLIELANAAGYTIEIDEYEGEKTPDDDSILKACFNLDEIHMIFHKDGQRIGWVFLVMGNSGYDLISDYTTNLEEFLKPAMELGDKLENGAFEITPS